MFCNEKRVLTIGCALLLGMAAAPALATDDALADFFGADGSTMNQKAKTPGKQVRHSMLAHSNKHFWRRYSKQQRVYRRAQTAMSAQGTTDMYSNALWSPMGPMSSGKKPPRPAARKKRHWLF